MVVDRLFARHEFGVKDDDEVAKETVGVKGCFLVEMVMGEVATPDVVLLEGAETGVRLVVGSELAVGEGLAGVELDEPHVGILSAVENGLEAETNATTTLAVGKEVVGACVGKHHAHGALAAGHKPLAAVQHLGEQ